MASDQRIWLIFSLLPCLVTISNCLYCPHSAFGTNILRERFASSKIHDNYSVENIEYTGTKQNPWVGDFVSNKSNVYAELHFKNAVQLENIIMNGSDVFLPNSSATVYCYVTRFVLEYKISDGGHWMKLTNRVQNPTPGKIFYKKFDSDNGYYNTSIGIPEPVTALKIVVKKWSLCPAVNIMNLHVCGVCDNLPNKNNQILQCKPYNSTCAYSCASGYEKNRSGGNGTKKCAVDGSWSGKDLQCDDQNECNINNTCDTDADCTNTVGSFTCTCKSGYQGDGKQCIDINECDADDRCDVNAKCINTRGNYTCMCNTGYSGNGRKCNDIDECNLSTHDCHKYANCDNTVGNFTCTCREGYKGDGKSCTGIRVQIEDLSPSQSVKFGAKLRLYCTAVGLPLPFVNWTFPRTERASIIEVVTTENAVTRRNSTLTINSVELSDDGSYTCVADNQDTSDQKTINITVDGKPESPSFSVKASDSSIVVSWMEPNSGASEIKGYIVSHAKIGGNTESKRTKNTVFEWTLTNLNPNTKYSVWVVAFNAQGASESEVGPDVVTLAPKPEPLPMPKKYSSGLPETSVGIQVKKLKLDSEIKALIQVIVGILSSRKKREIVEIPEMVNDYKTAMKNNQSYYIAAELENEDNKFVVGDGRTYGKYKNEKLQPGTEYNIYLRGVSFNSEKRPNYGAVSSPLKVSTEAVVPERNGDGGGNLVGIAVGLTVVLVAIVIAVVIGFLYLRSRTPKTLEIDPETGKMKKRKRSFNSELLPLTKKGGSGGKRKSSSAEDGLPDPNHPPVPVAAFAKHVGKLHKSDDRGFMIQYNTLESSQSYPSETALLTENKEKNRYANIIAYDVSRVHLRKVDDDENSHYINASLIDGYNSTNAYIATQGPLPQTFDDFWRMVWEQNCSSIIMLTNLQERHKLKCHKYWPEETETYGDITVTATRREQYADYVIRSFLMKMNETSEEREIKQFHFTVWPDHGVPEYPTAILAFQRRVRAYSTHDSGPLVVHCSAGVGRSGTFIVIDSMLARIQNEQTIDIYNYVRYLRTRRMFMVQTEEQYVFCHDALLESILCGNTQMSAHNLRIEMNRLRQTDPSTKMTGFETEFKTLNKVSPSLPKESFVVASYPENSPKNRYPSILASDHGRVTWGGIDEKEASPYINAVYVDGYKQQNAFILTQVPLAETAKDFWRMLYEKRSACVVLLSKLTEENGDFPQFWPEDAPEEYDVIKVELASDALKSDTSSEDLFQQDRQSGDLVVRKLKLTKEEDKPLVVKMFQHLSWKETSVPSDISVVISLVQRIEKWQQHSGNGPITVVCNDGLGRSGTFAALSSVLERVKTEQVVDVFQTIKALRIQRPGLVKDVEQYQFIHLGVQEYLDSFSDYANFK